MVQSLITGLQIPSTPCSLLLYTLQTKCHSWKDFTIHLSCSNSQQLIIYEEKEGSHNIARQHKFIIFNFKWALKSWKSYKVSLERALSHRRARIISWLLLVLQTHFKLLSEYDSVHCEKWSHLTIKHSWKLHASFTYSLIWKMCTSLQRTKFPHMLAEIHPFCLCPSCYFFIHAYILKIIHLRSLNIQFMLYY